MKRLPAAAAAMLAFVLATALPTLAKQFVQDGAGMFGDSTVSSLNTRIGNFNAQTGKEVVVVTVPSVSGGDVRAAAENAFAQQQVNGVLIFIDKGDRKDWIIPDQASVRAGWFTSDTSASIARAMEAQFKAGDFDGGITTAVSGVLNVYRSHVGSLRNSQSAPSSNGAYAQQGSASQGVHISVFWWIIIALIAFFVIRSLMRAASGPRYSGGQPGQPGQPGAPGAPGAPGYGPGYGYGGFGGGGFWSGLLGGLGGAWLGNELFRGGGGGIGQGGMLGSGDPDAGGGPAPDAGGWQSDPGQAGMGGSGGGDWGGGGFGGGDFGGGGGGDFGGGGGDAGGGW